MRLISTFTFILICTCVFSQETPDRLSVYLDCQMRCDRDYIKQEITFVNYQRDRQDVDIYILATSQNASAGAREVQLIFNYDGIEQLNSDTIVYYNNANISDLQERILMRDHLKIGLLPALALSSLKDAITYEVAQEVVKTAVNNQADDPWNYWAFNISLNLNVNGESTFNEQGYFARLSASRVTEKHKILISTWYDLDQSSFTLSDGEKVESKNERYRTFTQYVKSVGDHWAVGARSLFGSSSFGNTDFELSLRPAIEFNFYPYSENSTRRFSMMYSSGIVYNDYTSPTVFDKLNETLWRHSFDIEFEQTQQWGDISFDFEFDQYFKDLALYSISFNPNVELNLVKGLRLQFGGRISYVGDRINISKAEVSAQDIILQNRQLDTDYSYFTYVGFNFQFGSKNNNIVNPRF